ncbi:MAG: MBL fold metallo-hydrolase [Clostridia bacterium]|nr:MBL fold metallo-hydrolase [Clostridia bacterium]
MDVHSANIWMYVSSFSEEVTGSDILVQVNWSDGRQIKFLIDCGLFQEPRWEAYNEEKFPFLPENIDFAIATHFHTDHIGRFPYLMNEGFKNNIYTTVESKIMFPKMLNLNAEILEQKYVHLMGEWRKERNDRKKKSSLGKKDKTRCCKDKKKTNSLFKSKCIEHDMPKLIFTKNDVAKLQKQIVDLQLCEPFSPVDGIEITFYPNAHMLGAAVTVITAYYNDERLTFLVTGDVAKKNKVTGVETYVPKKVLDEVKFIISESTYGSSPEVRDVQTDYLRNVKLIEETIEKNNTLVYMVNAIERPEVVLNELQYIIDNEKIGTKLKNIPIYFDSTFGHVGLKEYQKILGDELQLPENLVLVDSENRLDVMKHRGAKILLLTSPQFYFGSFTAYAKALLEDKSVTIVFASYVSECITNMINLPRGTKIRYKNEDVIKNCSMYKFGHYSSHASIAELAELLDACENKNTILFVHGTNDAKDNMVSRFSEKGITTYSMLKGKTVRINRFGISKVY